MGTSPSPVPSHSFMDDVKTAFTFSDTRKLLRENAAPVTPAQPKAPIIKDAGTYKSLSDLQATGYAKDKKSAEFAAARNVHNVDSVKDPRLKMQAVTGKLQRVMDSDAYKSLDVSNRTRVLSHYYDKYVAPTLKANGIEPPEKADWIKGYGRTIESPDKEQASRSGTFASAAVSSAADMTKLVGNAINYTMRSDTEAGQKARAATGDRIISFANKLQKVSTDYDSTFESRHDASGWLANFGGHLLGDAPAYIAAAGLANEIIPSLAEKSVLSKGFKVGYAALKNAGEVMAVQAGEGKDIQDIIGGGVSTFLLGAGMHGAAAKFGAAKLAVGGMPFAETVARDADEIPERSSSPKALVNKNDPDYKQVVNNEKFLREHFAQEFHPDKAEGADGKSVWRNLSKGQRAKIKDHIQAITKQSAEVMPLVQPEIQTQANSAELAREAVTNPVFANRMQAIEKLTGLNVAATLTKMQAKGVAAELGLSSPARILESSFEGQGDMFGENLSRSKGARTVANKGLTNPLTPTSMFLEGTNKYLESNPATKSGYDYFENPEHHLLWVANHSNAPDSIKQAAFMRLRRDFNVPKDEAIKKGQWLAEHVSDLRDTGKLETEGNVYRSTRLSQRRYGTSYQKELYTDDLLASDLSALKKLTKAKPELKAPIESMLETLNTLRNKAQTPLTSRLRRNTQKELMDTLQRYK